LVSNDHLLGIRMLQYNANDMSCLGTRDQRNNSWGPAPNTRNSIAAVVQVRQKFSELLKALPFRELTRYSHSISLINYLLSTIS